MLEQLAKQFTDDLNSLLSSEKLDSDKLRPILEASLRKLKLVTREEFDAQAAVLQRTRQKLEALEAKLAELESQIGESDQPKA